MMKQRASAKKQTKRSTISLSVHCYIRHDLIVYNDTAKHCVDGSEWCNDTTRRRRLCVCEEDQGGSPHKPRTILAITSAALVQTGAQWTLSSFCNNSRKSAYSRIDLCMLYFLTTRLHLTPLRGMDCGCC